MLGGGNFTAQNKKLPGSYINFVNASKVGATVGERGVAAIAMELDWGKDGEIMTITQSDFNKNSLKILGYDYGNDKLKGVRDLLINIRTLYLYRLNGGTKASCTYATAKCSGVRGNDLKISIQTNIDDEEKFDVSTILGTKEMDKQIVASANELQDNDFVDFKKDATLAVTASTPLTGGSNAESVTGENHQDFLDKLEAYSFNSLGCNSDDESIKTLYKNFTKRLRDEMGVKFQTVIFDDASDYEGIINIVNETEEDTIGLIYWVTGIIAGCAINKSNTNKVYDGEYTVKVNQTQTELENSIDTGKLVLHKVGDEIRVLKDINSLVNTTDEKGEDFKNNQTIRVLDQTATDIANVFNNNYIGKVPNNQSGRVSLWNEIVSVFNQYQTLQAIEEFNSEEITVEQGNDKTSVVVNSAIQPVNAMEKLYMTVVVN